MSLRVWFLGVFFLARHKQGISALQFRRDTGVGSYQTAWTLLHKLRSGLTSLPAPLLKGEVEADGAGIALGATAAERARRESPSSSSGEAVPPVPLASP